MVCTSSTTAHTPPVRAAARKERPVGRCYPKDTFVPKLLPTLATRAAIVATTTAAVAALAMQPADEAPAAAPQAATAVVTTTTAAPVQRVALAAPTLTASTAMTNALGKLGAPYRWGATGPNAFDCSGLVTWAYRTAGVTLPRTSRAMSKVGVPVSRGELQPGDLVFFYRPVSHVGIYIGDGKIVHASNKRNPVKISEIARMPFNSARRV